jgi:hypothetical protein
VSTALRAGPRGIELASGLLDVTSETELDTYLNGLVTDAARAAGGTLTAGSTRALVSGLKRTAIQTLPTLRSVLGADLEPARGLGQSPAAGAARVYGLELEGLSAEDRDYEIARQFVRFAQAATGQAAPPVAERRAVPAPGSTVSAALDGAARVFAPGLLPRGPTLLTSPPSGPWVRRENAIVLSGIHPPGSESTTFMNTTSGPTRKGFLMFETNTQTAEYGRGGGGRRWRRRSRWAEGADGGEIGSREAEYGEAGYGSSGEYGEAGYGSSGEYGEAGYGPGEYGEAGYGSSGEYGEAGYGPGEYGEAGYGPGEYGEAGYGPGEYGEAGYGSSGEYGEAGYGPGEYGEAGYGPGEYGEAGYGPGEYGEAGYGAGETEYETGEAAGEGEGEEQFLPFIPIIGKVLGGLLGGLMKESEAQYAGEYGESEQYNQGEAGEAEEQFLHKIFMKVLGQEAEAGESAMSPAQESEFASQFMEVSNEAELDEFLSRIVNTIGRAVQGIGGAANSPQGRALIDAVKPLARVALPVIGGAIGSAVAPGIGTQIGRTLGSAAGSLFEVERPELSEEEQEFEVARRFVRLTSAAASDAATAPAGAHPQLVGEFAVVHEARHHARPLFSRALRAISPIARGVYGRRYGGYGRSYGGYGRYGGYRRSGAWGGPRRWGGYRGYGHRGYGYRPGYTPPYQPGAEPAPEPAPEPSQPPAQPGFRWVAVPIGAPPPPEPPPADAGPSGPPAPPGQSEFGQSGYGPGYGHMTGGPSGRWIRRAGKIIVLDV